MNKYGLKFEESYEDSDSFLKDIIYGGKLYNHFFLAILFLEDINQVLTN